MVETTADKKVGRKDDCSVVSLVVCWADGTAEQMARLSVVEKVVCLAVRMVD